jgi:thioredoxin 1
MSTAVCLINDDLFSAGIQGVVLVVFSAQWCSPCRAQAPVIEALGKGYGDKAHFIEVDIDKRPETAIRLGIQSIPTLILYKNGKEAHRFIGFQSAAALTKVLDKCVSIK